MVGEAADAHRRRGHAAAAGTKSDATPADVVVRLKAVLNPAK